MSVAPFITELWDASIVQALTDFIAIPSQSLDYDSDLFTNGLQEKAFDVIVRWVQAHKPAGTTLLLHTAPARTPFLHIEVAPFMDGTGIVLQYAHADKQPPMQGWTEGRTPYGPVYRDGMLYGRGGADDGYGVFAAITAMLDVQRRGKPHGRVHIVIEGAEESGDNVGPTSDFPERRAFTEGDLEFWIKQLKPKFGDVDLVICLDSGAASYDRMWLTDSLRGVGAAFVNVEICRDSIHSGIGGGVVPDPVRILRMLLDRLEDTATGAVKVPALNVEIPESVIANLQPFHKVPHAEFMEQYSFLPGSAPATNDHVELMLAQTWRPSMTVTGFDGAPGTTQGGNVIRPKSTMKLSFRLPPGADPEAAMKQIKEIVEKDPPYGAHVTCKAEGFCAGWRAPDLKPWLHGALQRASVDTFANSYGAFGCGGSIPFMTLLHELFPRAQFAILGVLGNASNAHGPNEMLHVPFAKGITNCVSIIVEDHAAAAGAAAAASS